MLFVKVVGKKHINVFTTDDFEIYVGKIKLYRNLPGDPLEVPLDKEDIVYIMDNYGETIDSLSPRLEE